MNITNTALAALLTRLARATEKGGSVHAVLEPAGLQLEHVLAEAAQRLTPTQPDTGNIIEIDASHNELRLICAANEARTAKHRATDDDAYHHANGIYRVAIDTGLGPLLPRLASSAAAALTRGAPKMQDDRPREPVQ